MRHWSSYLARARCIIYPCNICGIYFYPDGIIKYDGFSTPQIDGTISKETLYSSSQGYNAKISQDRLGWLYRLRRLRFYNYSTIIAPFSRTVALLLSFSHRLLSYSHRCYSRIAITTNFTFLLPHPMPSPFLYPKMMLHLRVVGQSLHIIIRSGWITSTRVSTVSFAVVLCSGRIRPTHARARRLLWLQAFDTCRYR